MRNSNKYDNSGYGPLLDLLEKELSPYIKLSEKSFRFFIESISKKTYLLKSQDNRIINLLLNNAKNTSFSIRLLSTWGQPIEGFALLRIRLEQLIVSSYLINEEPAKGLEPFKKFHPVIEYSLLKANDKNDNLKLALSNIVPELANGYNTRMKEIQKNIEKCFEISDDTYKRKWTNLFINQLAEHRDKLINNNNEISKIKLLDYYNTIYKIASSIVHSDIASLSADFITTDGKGMLKPQELYIFTNLITLVQFDIIQCYESAKYLKLNIDNKFVELNEEYLEQVKKDWGIISNKA